MIETASWVKEDGSATRSFSLLDNDNTIISGQFFLNGKFNTGNIVHKVVSGLDMGSKEYFADWTGLTSKTNYNIYDPQAGAANLTKNDFPVIDRSISLQQRSGSRSSQKNTYSALYIHDQLAFFNNALRLSVAGRFTTTKRTENTGKLIKNEVFTPRIGLSYSFMEGGSLYGVFDQTFEENYGIPLKSGKSLKPSRGSNIEFGIKKELINNTLQTSLSVYKLIKDNLTTKSGIAPNLFSEQIGESKSQGVEIDVIGRLLPNLNVVLNYAFTDARISKDKDPKNIGSALPGAAKHISNAWINYTILDNYYLKGLGFYLGYQWQKDRAAWPTGSSSILPDDYFSLDGGISYKTKEFDISMLVNNITDNYNYTGFFDGAWGYKHFGWRAAAPINFRIQLRYFF